MDFIKVIRAAFRCLGAAFDPTADVTPFLLAHVEAQLHQVRALDLRERVQQKIWVVVEEAGSAAGLAPRVANAVWDASFGAVAARLLRPEGRARSRTCRAGAELYRRVGAALGVPVEGQGEPARAIIVGELIRRAVA